MGNKKRKKGQNIALTVYTHEMIDICYPEYSEEEKLYFSLMTDTEKLEMIELNAGIKINDVRRVVIDESYLEWIEKNDYPNTEETRSRYALEVSKERAEDLWKKNNMDKVIIPMLLPLTMITENSSLPANEIRFTEKLANHVKVFVASTFQVKENDIWVYPAITRAEIWDEEEDERLFEFAYDYFNGTEAEYETPKMLALQKKINTDMRFIPVVVSYERKAELSYKELKKEMEPLILPKAAERLSESFMEEFSYGISFLPVLSMVEEAMDIRQGFIDSLEELKTDEIQLVYK